MALTIRKARRSDVDVLLQLSKELADHHKALTRLDSRLRPHLRQRKDAARVFAVRLRKCIRARNAALLVAEVDSRLVGYCLIYLKQNPSDPKADKLGFIDHLIVKKNFQGRRISSALTREAFAWFRGKGIRHLSLFVMENNRIPQAIYRKWGFFPFVIEMRKSL